MVETFPELVLLLPNSCLSALECSLEKAQIKYVMYTLSQIWSL